MWSKKEKEIARRAYESAWNKESTELLRRLKKMAKAAKVAEDIWRIHDFLTERIRDMDQKYDYRYSVLVGVFGRLVGEGWIGLDDLAGLSEDKIATIRKMAALTESPSYTKRAW